jgi:FixJ family two-component response regulator
VLLLTGQEEERVSIEGMVHPPNDFIPKPFAKADLLEKVKKLLSQGV